MIFKTTFVDRLFLYGGITLFLGLFGRWHWFLDIFSHFRVQQLILLAVFAALMALRKKWGRAAMTVLLIAVFGVPLLPYVPRGNPSGGVPDRSLSVLYINVNFYNKKFSQVLGLVRDKDPDVLVLSEINEPWDEALRRDLRGYPFGKVSIRQDNFGLALFSKIPLQNLEMWSLGEAQVPSFRGEFSREGKEYTLWATHPLPPVGPEYWRMRNEQIRLLREELDLDPRAKIVVGDLNAAPWCFAFAVAKGRDLRDAAEGKGVHFSWPSFWPGLLRVPLDHVLVSRDIPVKEYRVQRDIGSDHLPVFVRLEI
ncbi:MAG: endonuclease/exonuclease/phosphatase family protein [Candidatus Omnitrophota bacterium]|nr:endonuclease/exonuclease/phosphatase family protein [Candidatus Omnitrophota bacterium]MDZ4241889.1 endonuclease/exonuclease/phosphatase family protein [Candidatus Omnitrophota bacterium]